MDIRNFFGRPQSKPKSDTSGAPIRGDAKTSPSASRNGNPRAEKTPERAKATGLKSPAVTESKKTPKSPAPKSPAPKSPAAKSSAPAKRPIHSISSSDDEEAPSPQRAQTAKKSMSSEEYFNKNGASPAPKTGKKSPRSAPKKESPKKESLIKPEAETPKSSRRSETVHKSKTSKHPKLEIVPREKETPKKRRNESDDEEESSHKRQKQTPAVEPSPKGRASMGNGASYLAYLNREPPRHLGERGHPEGSPECMKKFTVVMTGVMDYVEKDEIKRVVEQCGGKITSSISGKTTHLIAGRDAGPAKVAKAHAVGAKVLEELEWFDFVESITDKSKAFKAKEKIDPIEEVMMEIEEAESKKASPKKATADSGDVPNKGISPRKLKNQDTRGHQSEQQPSTSTDKVPPQKPALMWVDKYMPSSTKQIIGQQGDQSNVAKLRRWLTQWSTKQKAPFNKFKNPTGAGLRAALLSGPPGVGKTTSAHLVCKELGFEIIEMNASDTRSKRSLKEEVATLLSNRTLNSGRGNKSKHVLIMDEVDGMSGNQDRGGMQELIQLIKSSMVPIICICNDRTHPKMRSLVNYCFDLRFYKPQVKQIQAALMSLCFKEGMKVPPKTMEEIIVASNQDIRQCVHSLNLFCAISDSSSRQQVTKDVKIGPFDVVKKFLIYSEGGSLNLNEKQSLFFNDYNAIPLFVQENYIRVQPKDCKRKRDLLRRVSESSEAICVGDTIERQIRSSNAWTLLPAQAMYSAVIPSIRMQGTMREMVNFPGWFGKYSTTSKHARQAQALTSHMKCAISGDTFETTTQYMPLMAKKIMQPLLREGESGVAKVVEFMDEYSLQRSDVDAMLELTTWNSQGKDPFADVPAKVKAKLTRSLNKNQMLRYATDDMIKSKGKKIKKEKSKTEDDEDLDDASEEEVDVDFD